jgi:hypothetical protein
MEKTEVSSSKRQEDIDLKIKRLENQKQTIELKIQYLLKLRELDLSNSND